MNIFVGRLVRRGWRFLSEGRNNEIMVIQNAIDTDTERYRGRMNIVRGYSQNTKIIYIFKLCSIVRALEEF